MDAVILFLRVRQKPGIDFRTYTPLASHVGIYVGMG